MSGALGLGFGELLLLRPLWLVALLPVLLGAVLVARRPRPGAWAGRIDAPILARLRAIGTLAPPAESTAWLARQTAWLLPPPQRPFLLAGLLVLALAGPARLSPGALAADQPGQPRFLRGDPLVIVLDMSPSVAATPALAQAQTAAAALLQAVEGRPVALLLYAADAYLASAPSRDPASLQGLIAVLDDQTMPVSGSRPDIALAEARALFPPADRPAGGLDLVLISDGAGIGPQARAEAALLAREGARLWALGVTPAAGNANSTKDLPAGLPPPDHPALAALAAEGGGGFAPAQATGDLIARMGRAQRAALIASPSARALRQDLGPWLLLLALPLALGLARRQS